MRFKRQSIKMPRPQKRQRRCWLNCKETTLRLHKNHKSQMAQQRQRPKRMRPKIPQRQHLRIRTSQTAVATVETTVDLTSAGEAGVGMDRMDMDRAATETTSSPMSRLKK